MKAFLERMGIGGGNRRRSRSSTATLVPPSQPIRPSAPTLPQQPQPTSSTTRRGSSGGGGGRRSSGEEQSLPPSQLIRPSAPPLQLSQPTSSTTRRGSSGGGGGGGRRSSGEEQSLPPSFIKLLTTGNILGDRQKQKYEAKKWSTVRIQVYGNVYYVDGIVDENKNIIIKVKTDYPSWEFEKVFRIVRWPEPVRGLQNYIFLNKDGYEDLNKPVTPRATTTPKVRQPAIATAVQVRPGGLSRLPQTTVLDMRTTDRTFIPAASAYAKAYKKRADQVSRVYKPNVPVARPVPQSFTQAEKRNRIIEDIADVFGVNKILKPVSDVFLQPSTKTGFESTLSAMGIEDDKKYGFMINSLPHPSRTQRSQTSQSPSPLIRCLHIIMDVSGSINWTALDNGILKSFFEAQLPLYDNVVVYPWASEVGTPLILKGSYFTGKLGKLRSAQKLQSKDFSTLFDSKNLGIPDGHLSAEKYDVKYETPNFDKHFRYGRGIHRMGTSEIALGNALDLCFKSIENILITQESQPRPHIGHYIVPFTDGAFDTRMQPAQMNGLNVNYKNLKVEGKKKGHIFSSALLSVETFDINFLRLAKMLDALFFGCQKTEWFKNILKSVTIEGSFEIKNLPQIQLLEIEAFEDDGNSIIPIDIRTSSTLDPNPEGLFYRKIYFLMGEMQGFPIFLNLTSETRNMMTECYLLVNGQPFFNTLDNPGQMQRRTSGGGGGGGGVGDMSGGMDIMKLRQQRRQRQRQLHQASQQQMNHNVQYFGDILLMTYVLCCRYSYESFANSVSETLTDMVISMINPTTQVGKQSWKQMIQPYLMATIRPQGQSSSSSQQQLILQKLQNIFSVQSSPSQFQGGGGGGGGTDMATRQKEIIKLNKLNNSYKLLIDKILDRFKKVNEEAITNSINEARKGGRSMYKPLEFAIDWVKNFLLSDDSTIFNPGNRFKLDGSNNIKQTQLYQLRKEYTPQKYTRPTVMFESTITGGQATAANAQAKGRVAAAYKTRRPK